MLHVGRDHEAGRGGGGPDAEGPGTGLAPLDGSAQDAQQDLLVGQDDPPVHLRVQLGVAGALGEQRAQGAAVRAVQGVGEGAEQPDEVGAQRSGTGLGRGSPKPETGSVRASRSSPAGVLQRR